MFATKISLYPKLGDECMIGILKKFLDVILKNGIQSKAKLTHNAPNAESTTVTGIHDFCDSTR